MSTLIEANVVDLTSDEFLAMVEAGIFEDDRRVFLWAGRVYEKMAKTQSHAIASVLINKALVKRLPEEWEVSPENPVRLDGTHVPLPDYAVVRGPFQQYSDHPPRPEDVGLIIEIAVSILSRDVRERAEQFARAGVPAYWVIDVNGRQILEHRDPQTVDGGRRYATIRCAAPGEEIELILDGVSVARVPVAELIG
jgi:Uma2 family endonuclease